MTKKLSEMNSDKYLDTYDNDPEFQSRMDARTDILIKEYLKLVLNTDRESASDSIPSEALLKWNAKVDQLPPLSASIIKDAARDIEDLHPAVFQAIKALSREGFSRGVGDRKLSVRAAQKESGE